MQDQRQASPSDDRGKKLLFYQVGILVLLVVIVALSAALQSTTSTFEELRVVHAQLKRQLANTVPEDRLPQPRLPPQTQRTTPEVARNLAPVAVADLSVRVADIQRHKAHKSDVSETFFKSDEASVHMHVIGVEQTCPLHIHRVTEEMTVVVTGAPDITHVFADGEGGLTRQEGKGGQGALYYSPPFCAHRWQNRDAEQMQANLVFATPPFDGNFYLEPDDPRMLKAEPPRRFDPDQAIDALKGSGEPSKLDVLDGMGGKMSTLVASAGVWLPLHDGEQILYVARGKGRVESGVSLEIKPQTLVIVQPNRKVEVRPDQGEVVVAYVFKPVMGGR